MSYGKRIPHCIENSKPTKSSKFSPCKKRLFELVVDTFKPNRKGIAAAAEIGLSTLNSGLNHTPPKFSLFSLPGLFAATNDHRVLSYLAEICNYQIIRLPSENREENTRQAQIDLSLVLGECQKTLCETLHKRMGRDTDDLAMQLNFVIAGAVRLRELLKNKDSDEKK
ncbi:MAG: phage regulatory CII family protein [Candidatus Omnitrophota bacterium]